MEGCVAAFCDRDMLVPVRDCDEVSGLVSAKVPGALTRLEGVDVGWKCLDLLK